MSVSEKIRGLMSIQGKKHGEMAAAMNMTAHSWSNKLARGSFSADDLIKISDILETQVIFRTNKGIEIALDKDDIR